MRIGTWNLEGKWTPSHDRVLRALDCDVWLLTEVHSSVALDGAAMRFSCEVPGGAFHWAAILSRIPMLSRPGPHAASVTAEAHGITFMCSVLPWPLCGDQELWEGATPTERMTTAVGQVLRGLERRVSVWGGDWNQPLAGDLRGFGRASKAVIDEAVERLGMAVPTAHLPGRNPEQGSIDHIAVPREWTVVGAGAQPVPRPLSDHDAYWVEVAVPEGVG